MIILYISIAAFISTLLGGLFAIKFKDKLHLILGFSAGAVIGVAFFDLIPEALELGSKFYDSNVITTYVALGFIIYMILDRSMLFHSHGEIEHGHDHNHEHNHGEVAVVKKGRGILGAVSLSVHSFLDGVAIGLAFQVSSAVGLVVAIAVLVHDFSDGINTVNMVLKNNGEKRGAFKWLLVDAIAPVVGVVSTLFFTLPEKSLSLILALFAGFFLYIGASDLLPESHHGHPKVLTTVMTLLGIAVLYIAIHLAHF